MESKMNKLFYILSVLFFFISGKTHALDNEMNFELHYQDSRSSADPVFILAKGTIVESTPQKFKEFLKKIDFMPYVYFDSPGGNLIAGIELGQIIRDKGFSTYVSDKYAKIDYIDLDMKEITISKNAICHSACVYAFIGGVGREVSNNAKLGVHQFFSEKENMGDSNTQHLTAILSNYIDKMEVDRKLLDIASTTEKKDITYINHQLAVALNIDNVYPKKEPWTIKANNNGDIYICTKTTIKSKKALGELCIFKSKTNLSGQLTYSIDQKFRKPDDIADIYTNENKNKEIMPPYFYIKNKQYNLKSGNWERLDEKTYSINFLLSNEIIIEIPKNDKFAFEGNFANYARDIQPAVEFTSEKFRESILALLKK